MTGAFETSFSCSPSSQMGPVPLHRFPTGSVEGAKATRSGPAAEITEDSLSTIAEGLVGLGCRQLIVAGGETSGAVVRRLGITTADVGKEVSPGVPWLITETDPGLSILLKSGNLGKPGLFLDAWGHNRRATWTAATNSSDWPGPCTKEA